MNKIVLRWIHAYCVSAFHRKPENDCNVSKYQVYILLYDRLFSFVITSLPFCHYVISLITLIGIGSVRASQREFKVLSIGQWTLGSCFSPISVLPNLRTQRDGTESLILDIFIWTKYSIHTSFLHFDAFSYLQNGLISTMEVTVCSQDGEVSLNFVLPEGLTEETCSTSLLCAYQVRYRSSFVCTEINKYV